MKEDMGKVLNTNNCFIYESKYLNFYILLFQGLHNYYCAVGRGQR
ncbi:hypothetical protein SAMN04487761_1566 [Lachnospiraceae bacterium C7]|nr:hypothetical protein SAMN04487761_1566 [Lachnospiraceae bacterium C7]